jgi:hypothetical protein
MPNGSATGALARSHSRRRKGRPWEPNRRRNDTLVGWPQLNAGEGKTAWLKAYASARVDENTELKQHAAPLDPEIACLKSGFTF